MMFLSLIKLPKKQTIESFSDKRPDKLRRGLVVVVVALFYVVLVLCLVVAFVVDECDKSPDKHRQGIVHGMKMIVVVVVVVVFAVIISVLKG